MEHIEMIEKLREKAGITREEAADALTRANWDMLEALVILEREGKVKPLTSSVVTASPQAYGSYGQNGANGTYSSYGTYDPNTPGSSYGTRGPAGPTAGDRLKALFRNAVIYSLIVRRNGKVVISLPVFLFAGILLAAFRLSAVALLLGLFLGCKYSVEKRDEGDGASDEPHSDY